MPPAAGNFTPPAGWRSRLDAVDQVVNRRSILSGESSAAQTPSGRTPSRAPVGLGVRLIEAGERRLVEQVLKQDSL